MDIATPLAYTINGKKRRIPRSSVNKDTADTFIVHSYYRHYIKVTFDESHRYFEKPWYAECFDESGSYAVDGWVGRTKEHAILVCLQNIFFTSTTQRLQNA